MEPEILEILKEIAINIDELGQTLVVLFLLWILFK